MPTPTRYLFTQSYNLGEGGNLWQYEVKISRVVDPYLPTYHLPETVASTTVIPQQLFVLPSNQKKSFDLAHVGDGDKIENVKIECMDDTAGTWFTSNIFTTFAANVAYQLELLCDKGTGTLKTIFFGEMEVRSLNFEPEYMFTPDAGTTWYRKQKISFEFKDIFISTMQAMPFGDDLQYPVGTSTSTRAFGSTRSSSNRVLSQSTINAAHGLMYSFSNYKTLGQTAVILSCIERDRAASLGGDHIQMNIGDTVFAVYKDIITLAAQTIANRMGWTTGTADTSDAFSHLKLYYGGAYQTNIGATQVANIDTQLMFHRTRFLATNTVFTAPNTPQGLQPVHDCSFAKQGTAWDGLELMFMNFLQCAKLEYDSASSTVTLRVTSPLSSNLSTFLGTEPKFSKLKYTPYGFAARSVSVKAIEDETANGKPPSTTTSWATDPTIPTNNISLVVPFTNANQDFNAECAAAQYWNLFVESQLTVLKNGSSTLGAVVDSNANGVMQAAGLLTHNVTINTGFFGSIGTYDGLTLNDAIANGLFSMFCGQTISDGVSSATSFPMEVVESEFVVDQYCETLTPNVYVDTRDIDAALLKTMPITTDSQHTFIVTSVDVKWFDEKRIAKIVAVRQVT